MMTSEPIPNELLGKYEITVIEISFENKILSPRELYKIWESDFFMITAANPFSQLLAENENRRRNQMLYDLLSPQFSEILSAIGRDPEGTWIEHGWIVRASNVTQLVALAQHFQQNAIFRFTSDKKEVVLCV